MFFTREDINKIYQALLKLGIKDSELPETSDVKNDDTLAIVQDGKNKQINVREFLNQISLWKREDFINVTDKYKKSHITLVEAIQAIPIVQRKEGLVITFLDTENNWRIYQFRGSLLQFNNETLWTDLYDFSPYIIDSILPDEEDITQSAIDGQGNTYLSLKDRTYNPSEFSGKGYKILRKNIIEIEDANSNKVKKNILTKEMISEPNTVYEIRYDFDLNGKKITIPENCTLDFNGGSLNNGEILFRNCTIQASIVSLLFKNIRVTESNNVEEQQIANDYILADFFYDGNDIGKATNSALKLCKHVKYLRKIYILKTPIIMSNNSMLTGMGEDKINEKSGYQPKCTEIITEENINAIECNQANSCKISNIGLYNRLESNLSRGILITNSTHITLNDITIIGFDIGIEHKGGFGCLFNKIIISNAYQGMNLNPSSESQVNGGVYTGISCKFCNIGYKIFDCNNLTFINCSGEVIHKDYSIKGREGSQVSAGWNIQEGTEIILINPYLEGADTFIYQRYSIERGQLAIIGAYYNSHAGETYVKPFTDGLFGYLKNTTIIGLTITNTYYSGSGTPTHQGMIYLSNNCHVSNVRGGMATVNGDNITITNCKFAVERFGGIWTDNKFHPNNVIQGKSNIGTSSALNDIGNTLKLLPNNTNPGLYAFNSSLDKPSWWDGSNWINAEGFKINKNRGTTSERPTLTREEEGFGYYDSTLKKKILWNGTEWTNIDGTAL